MNPSKLFKRDREIRKKLKWSMTAFISPKLPKPRTKAEIAVRQILENQEYKSIYSVHIYEVHWLMEQAFKAGIKSGKKSKNASR